MLSTGDTFNNLKRYQFIDYGNGGDVRGMIRAADAFLKASNDTTKIVPGHGPLATRADVIAFRDMLVASRDRIEKLYNEGKSEQDVVATEAAGRSRRDMGGERAAGDEPHTERL